MKSLKAWILLGITLFLCLSPSVIAQKNEGYGESETALGQTVDTFETLNNVSVRVLTELNSTDESMELNFTASSGTLFNYSAMTKTGANSRLTVTDSNITTNPDFRRGTEEGYYLDYGAGNIGAFDLSFQFVVSDVEAGDADNRDMGSIFAVTNWVGDFQNRPVGTYDYLIINIRNNAAIDDTYTVRMIAGQNGANVVDEITSAFAVNGSIIYATVSRTAAGDVNVSGYSDVLRTHANKIFSLADNTNAFSDSVRYLYGWFAVDALNDATDYFVGSVANLFNGSISFYQSAGYFTTLDYLRDPTANGSALVVMVDTDIPTNTEILFQISSDNSTWRDHNGTAGNSEDLLGGFESFDLRNVNYSTNIYFRCNLSTTDNSITPRVNQIRLITMIGVGGAGPGGTTIQNVTGEWVYYNLTQINTTIGTHDHGLVNDTYWVDSLFFNCSEVVGVPGYEVKFNVTGIDTDAISVWLVCYVYYDGSASHIINVQLWNISSNAWVTIGTIPDQLGFEWINSTVYRLRIPNDYLNSTGAIAGRFYHASAGNVNHDISFDRISFQAFIPSDVAAVAAEESFFIWIALAIALMLIAIMLSKAWFERSN